MAPPPTAEGVINLCSAANSPAAEQGEAPPELQMTVPSTNGGWLSKLFGNSLLKPADAAQSASGAKKKPPSQAKAAGKKRKKPEDDEDNDESRASLQSQIMQCEAGRVLDALDSISDILPTQMLADVGLEFPEIAVVGQESTGKSSVLERITMLPLFPRGTDIVTRMPIRLKLHHINDSGSLKAFCAENKLQANNDAFYLRAAIISRNSTEAPDWTPFEGPLYAKDTSRMDSDLPTKKISELMRLASLGPDGQNIGVNDALMLQLEVKSRQLPNLVLVDLPGIVGSAVFGEPDDLADKTQKLVSDYIQKEDCLALAIVESTAASVRNSKAFSIIADKASKSIGVLTKCDQCGTKVQLQKLLSRVEGTAKDTPALGYGYVAVINRDSEDEDSAKLSLHSGIVAELDWFEKNLPSLKEKKRATGDVLVEKLVEMLTGYVKNEWAGKALLKLKALLDEQDAELATLGAPVPSDEKSRKELLKSLVNDFRGSLIANLSKPGNNNVYVQQMKQFFRHRFVFKKSGGELSGADMANFLSHYHVHYSQRLLSHIFKELSNTPLATADLEALSVEYNTYVTDIRNIMPPPPATGDLCNPLLLEGAKYIASRRMAKDAMQAFEAVLQSSKLAELLCEAGACGGSALPWKRDRFVSVSTQAKTVVKRHMAELHESLKEDTARHITRICDDICVNEGLTTFHNLFNHLPVVTRQAVHQIDRAMQTIVFILLSHESKLGSAAAFSEALIASTSGGSALDKLLKEDAATAKKRKEIVHSKSLIEGTLSIIQEIF